LCERCNKLVMELHYLLFVAAAASVSAGLVNSLFAPLRGKSPSEWRAQTFAAQLATIGIHLCAGLGLGLLFWLSWGLTAVVGVPWWLRGLIFALVIWCVCFLPLLAKQLMTLRMHWSVAIAIAMEWLVTLSIVGLACAWSWAKGP
jgi:hypothetical protein